MTAETGNGKDAMRGFFVALRMTGRDDGYGPEAERRFPTGMTSKTYSLEK
jgi:hypothetical protein